MAIRFLVIFLCTQILIIFLHIHQHTRITQLLYKKQRLEKTIQELHTTSAELQHELIISSNKNDIKIKALQKGMQGLRLPRVSKVPHVES